MVMPSTRTLEENPKVTSSYSVTPTNRQVINHGVAQHPGVREGGSITNPDVDQETHPHISGASPGGQLCAWARIHSWEGPVVTGVKRVGQAGIACAIPVLALLGPQGASATTPPQAATLPAARTPGPAQPATPPPPRPRGRPPPPPPPPPHQTPPPAYHQRPGTCPTTACRSPCPH